jgi:hypothetical protein
MYRVIITYVNGEKVEFDAAEFDVDFRNTAPSEEKNALRKFTYKDEDGNDTFIYLTPAQVAGIVLVGKLEPHSAPVR